MQDYLDRNKSLNQGSLVAGRIQQDVDAANEEQRKAESEFKSRADAGTTTINNPLIDQAKSDPVSVASDTDKFQSFLKQRDAEYKGPSNLVDTELYQPAFMKTDRARERADLTKSEGGRKALLQEFYGSGVGRSDYSPGQLKLDNLLIQNDPTAKQAFQSLQNNATTTQQNLGLLSDRLRDYAQGKKAETQSVRNTARGALGLDQAGNLTGSGAIGDLRSSIDARLTDRRKNLTDSRDTLTSTWGKKRMNEVHPETRQFLSIGGPAASWGGDIPGFNLVPTNRYAADDPQWGGYRLDPSDNVGLNFSDYLSIVPDVDVNRGTVSTADEVARLKALDQLAGREYGDFIPPEAQNIGSRKDGPLYTWRGSAMEADRAARVRNLYGELAENRQKYTNAMNSGGIIDSSRERADVNAIRARYGLPPV